MTQLTPLGSHAWCPECGWFGLAAQAPSCSCPLCSGPTATPLYDALALMQSSETSGTSGREEIGGRFLNTLPQWQNVAWQLKPTLCESDYFFYLLYRRNWCRVEVEKLTQEDWEFINNLGHKYGPDGKFDPLPHWADMSIEERQREAQRHELPSSKD